MPRRGVSLAVNHEDLLGGGDVDTTSRPGRETRPAAPRNDAAAQADINARTAAAASATPAGDTAPTIVVEQPPTGGGPDVSVGESGGDTGDAGDAGDGFKRGGMVHGPGAEHPITAQAGEYVINAAAVKKYGLHTIEAINRGKANVVARSAAAQHFAPPATSQSSTVNPAVPGYAAGGPVGHGSGRFAALESKLASRGDIRDPAALAASIGRKKYGTSRFARLSHGGH